MNSSITKQAYVETCEVIYTPTHELKSYELTHMQLWGLMFIRGVLPKNLGGVCHALLETLALFQTSKITTRV